MAEFTNPLERWNTRFSKEGFLFGEQPNAFLLEQERYLQKGSVLAIADGEGRNSVWLAQLGLAVDAFDFSPVAIAKAELLAQKKQVKVNFHCTAWEDFDFVPNQYDYVVGIFFQFVGPEKRTQLFQKMIRTLKVGGLMIIQGYGKNQLQLNTGGPGELDHLYDEELIQKLMPNFDWHVIQTYDAQINEGTGHSGLSSLVGVVAKKLI